MRSLELSKKWKQELQNCDEQIKWWEDNSEFKNSVSKAMVNKWFKHRGLILETIMELESQVN